MRRGAQVSVKNRLCSSLRKTITTFLSLLRTEGGLPSKSWLLSRARIVRGKEIAQGSSILCFYDTVTVSAGFGI